MIYFVSKNFNQVYSDSNIVIIDSNEEFKNLITIFDNVNDINVDLETTGTDAYINDILLVAVGNSHHQIIIDDRDEEIRNTTSTLLKSLLPKTIIGQNIKFDLKFLLTKYDIDYKNLYDTMIVEQRLYQGAGITQNNPQGLSFGLEAIVSRRIPSKASTIDKTVRERFINANKENFVFTNRDILYTAIDVTYLEDIKYQQEKEVAKNGQQFLINSIENPLVRIIAKAELQGFKLNETKWLALHRDNVQKKYAKELENDKEIALLRDSLLDLTDDEKARLKGGKFNYVRPEPVKVNMVGLFGEKLGNKEIFGKKTKKVTIFDNVINYTSATEIIDLFARFKQPLPTANGEFIVPMFDKDGKIQNSYQNFTTGAKELDTYLNEFPDSPMRTFIKNLIDIRSYDTKINTFGENFIDKYTNPITKKVHTIFRQCEAVTSRFQSGGRGDIIYYNAQNIPAEKDYRHCFIAEDGYSITTADLTGAEVIIMCSKAQESELKRMAIEEDDIHSPLAQAVWRSIYLYRSLISIGRIQDSNQFTKEFSAYTSEYLDSLFLNQNLEGTDAYNNYILSKEYIVTKKINKQIRTEFKNTTFGSVYGMSYKKAARTLGVSYEEGKICLFIIKSKIPKTFRMVEANAKLAITQGFVILNNRTNSKLWYPQVIRSKRYKTDLEFLDRINAESSARNSPIQGTQADMIKEMIVEIQNYIDNLNLPCYFIKSIHDELVYKQPTNMDGVSDQWKANPIKVKFINHKHEETEGSFPELVGETMKRVANRYLTNIEMQVEVTVEPYWTK